MSTRSYFPNARRWRRPLASLLGALLALGVTLPSAQAALVTWTGAAGGGLWSTPGNWSTNMLPTGGDTVENNINSNITFNTTATIDSFLNSNAGTFAMTAGMLTMGHDFANTGSGAINISGGTLSTLGNINHSGTGQYNLSGGTITVDGSFIGAGTGTVTISGSTLRLNGNFDSNSVVSLTAGALVGGPLSGGVPTSIIQVNNTFNINGGTLRNFLLLPGTGGQTITFGVGNPNNTLDGVTVAGNLVLNNGGYAHILNGLTFSGANRQIQLDFNNSTAAVMGFERSQTLSNVTVLFGSNAGGATLGTASILGTSENGSTLTLSDSVLVHGKYGAVGSSVFNGGVVDLVNNGIISADVSGGNVYVNPNGTLTNNSIIEARNGATLNVLTQNLNNAGTLRAQSGSNLTISALNYNMLGTIQANGGSVTLGGTLTNTGALNTALQASSGGRFLLSGTLVNTGQTLDTVAIGSPLIVSGGTLRGGTVNGLLNFAPGVSGSTLDGVAVAGDLDLTNGSTVKILNGLTFTGASRQIQLDFANSAPARIGFEGNQTLNNVTVVFGSTFSSPSILGISGNGSTLTLGSGATVRGKYGVLGQSILSGGAVNLVNNGTVSADVSGGAITINPNNTFTNTGTLQAINGATLNIQPAGTSTHTGTVRAGAGSTVNFSQNYTQDAGATIVDGALNSGQVNLQAGTLSGSGLITSNIRNAATVKPGGLSGNAPGILTLEGNYTQTAMGALTIEIGGSMPGTQLSQLRTSGPAMLDGTLNIKLLNGIQPNVGTTYDILTYSSETGTFSAINALDPGFSYDVIYGPSVLTLTVTQSTVPGPESIVVLGLGLLGVVGRLRRRQKP